MFPLNYGDGVMNQSTYGKSIFLALFPYMELQAVYDKWDQNQNMKYFEKPRKDPGKHDNAKTCSTPIDALLCPSDDTEDGLLNARRGNGVFTINGRRDLAVNNYKVCSGSNWDQGIPGDVNGAVPPDINSVCSTFGRNAGRIPCSNSPPKALDGLDHGNGFTCRNSCAIPHPTNANDCNPPGSNLTVRRGTLFTTRIRDIRDGTSNTFALGETIPFLCAYAFWAYYEGTVGTAAVPLNLWRKFPADGPQSWHHKTGGRREELKRRYSFGFMSSHPGGANFGLCDGSVRFVEDTVDQVNIYRPMATISGSEIIPEIQ